MLARLRVRVCRSTADNVDWLVALATGMGRPGRAAALGLAAASLFAVSGLAALGPGTANSAATVEVSLAQTGAVIVVGAVIEEATAPATAETLFVAATTEPTPSATSTALLTTAKPQPVANAVAQEAAAPSAAPVAAPVAAPSTGKQYTSEEVRGFARQAGWPDSLAAEVVTVADCESSLFSGARGGPALGLMQVVAFWFDKAGVDSALWSDPVANLRVAYYVYSHGVENGDAPWSAWGCKPPPPAATATPTPAPPAPTVATASPAAKYTPLTAAPVERH